jgi:hypothetical protein
MANPFSGIITPEFKAIFKNAIDALLEDTALTVPCRLVLGDTRFTDCPNCVYDAVNRRSSNKYTPGGPIPFRTGICPYCHGNGRIETDPPTITIYSCVVWEPKQWIGWTQGVNGPVAPGDLVQTLNKKTDLTNIKRAKEIIIDTDIEQYVHNRFVRDGEPNMCGLGDNEFVWTMWARAGG